MSLLGYIISNTELQMFPHYSLCNLGEFTTTTFC